MLLITALVACAGLPDPTANRGEMIAVDMNTQEFVRDVARIRHTQYGSLQNRTAYGIYLGSEDGCTYVAVMLATPGIGVSGRIDNYQVCAQRVSVFQPNVVAPSYPDSRDAVYTLDQAINNALLYGTHTANYQAYHIRIERLGFPSLRGCQPVDVVITYDNMLSYYDRRSACQYPK